MYVKALTHGLSPLPPAQPALRAELEALDVEPLMQRLRALDPVTAQVIDARNKRRLVRAVEVCVTTGRRFSDFRDLWDSPPGPSVPAGVFLVRNRDELISRIDRRVESMFAHGVVDEVRAVSPEALSHTATRMIGWREVQAHLLGQISLKACRDRIRVATRQYAKRQMTWFHKESVFEEMLVGGSEDATRTAGLILERMQRQPPV